MSPPMLRKKGAKSSPQILSPSHRETPTFFQLVAQAYFSAQRCDTMIHQETCLHCRGPLPAFFKNFFVSAFFPRPRSRTHFPFLTYRLRQLFMVTRYLAGSQVDEHCFSSSVRTFLILRRAEEISAQRLDLLQCPRVQLNCCREGRRDCLASLFFLGVWGIKSPWWGRALGAAPAAAEIHL